MVFPVVAGNAHEPLVRPVHADDVAIGQVRPGEGHGTALEQEGTLFGGTIRLFKVLDSHIGRPDIGHGVPFQLFQRRRVVDGEQPGLGADQIYFHASQRFQTLFCVRIGHMTRRLQR